MDSNGLADPYVKLHLLPGASKVQPNKFDTYSWPLLAQCHCQLIPLWPSKTRWFNWLPFVQMASLKGQDCYSLSIWMSKKFDWFAWQRQFNLLPERFLLLSLVFWSLWAGRLKCHQITETQVLLRTETDKLRPVFFQRCCSSDLVCNRCSFSIISTNQSDLSWPLTPNISKTFLTERTATTLLTLLCVSKPQ